ncbi:hypothetical protein K491DRAFT_779952 [Lophiostoma macrostomum CBS 122681]|uniref:Metallo-beta-lactamase domain-containing protein n=1 Tax=Lophiostoma macrostomum CBS 122681 TaxID=1314788 RepID=A0A6A6T5Q2_9PLEO|nr:hypothetical protein K491DRAFT_779952 [Lophiostoma macrostomum CBS 122681]
MRTLDLPSSRATVSVSIIDSTACAYNLPCANLFWPPFKGLHTLDICSYAFLLRHGTGDECRHVLFDLGIRKDWQNLVPSMVSRLKEWDATIKVETHVADIMQKQGLDLARIEAIVWSHLHWDHTGDPSTFPPTTKLIVGPGVKDRYMPGWPKVDDAGFRESDIANRQVVGLESEDFDKTVGGFKAHDYFGDGSLYLLDAPGHALGHLNALARTSAEPESFVFLTADSVHLGGEIRLSDALPLPDPVEVPGIVPCPCPAADLTNIHPLHSATKPFLGLDPSFPEHLEDAEHTIELIQKFDADERVFVIFSHDTSIYDVVDFFPNTADDWRLKDWKKRGMWTFLTHLQKTARAD